MKHENLLHKELSYQIQGAAFEVRKNFGSGLKEIIYQNAFAEELEARNLKFEREKSIQIFSPKTGKLIGSYRPDFIIENKIVIELKAVEQIPKKFLDQIFSYLRNSEYELGYFINFASPKLYLKRIIFTNDHKPFLQNMRKDMNVKRAAAKISCIFAFLFVLFSVLPCKGQAAGFFINSTSTPNGQYGMNQQWQADIFLDSGGESINAVEGKLLFPADLLSVKTISDGNSAVNLWIEKPRLESAGSIGFSGITPGGYGGRQGLVFSVVFSAEKEGGGALAFAQTRALLNDGEGTAAPIATSGWPFMISSQLPAPALAAPPDTSPPEEFFPQITRNAELFNGQWFLVFAAADKGSGIAGYEVKETRNTNPKAGKWLPTESPYLLQDQGLTSYIYIKAADQAGNGRIETIKPRHPSAPGPNNISLAWAIAGAAIFLIGAGYVIIILWRKKNKRHSKS